MTTTPRRDPYGAQPSEPSPGQASVKPDEDKDEVATPMYVTDNPSVYGEPPKEEKPEDK